MLPNARIYVALHQARNLPPDAPDYQTPHRHDTDELYFFIGTNPDLSGLAGQIKFEGKTHEIDSPATVYIPKGTVHEYKVTRGQGTAIVLLRKLDYGHTSAEPDAEKGHKEAERFARYIFRPDRRATSEIKHHHDTAPGDRYVFIDHEKMAVADFYTSVRTALNVEPTQANYIDRHAHTCDSYKLLIGNRPDLTGLKAEVAIGAERSIVEAPAAVYIPEGVSHQSRLISGSGQFFSIVPKGTYNQSLV